MTEEDAVILFTKLGYFSRLRDWSLGNRTILVGVNPRLENGFHGFDKLFYIYKSADKWRILSSEDEDMEYTCLEDVVNALIGKDPAG